MYNLLKKSKRYKSNTLQSSIPSISYVNTQFKIITLFKTCFLQLEVLFTTSCHFLYNDGKPKGYRDFVKQ